MLQNSRLKSLRPYRLALLRRRKRNGILGGSNPSGRAIVDKTVRYTDRESLRKDVVYGKLRY